MARDLVAEITKDLDKAVAKIRLLARRTDPGHPMMIRYLTQLSNSVRDMRTHFEFNCKYDR